VFAIENTTYPPRCAINPQLVQVSTFDSSGFLLAPLADFPALSSNGIKARAAYTDPVATFS
jgi:hypothetical protein